MREDTFWSGLVDDPAVVVLLLEDAGLHFEVFERLGVAFVGGGAEALYRVRCVLDALHCDGLQARELVEDVEELAYAEVPLHLRLADELNVAEDELLQPAAEVLAVRADTLVREHMQTTRRLHRLRLLVLARRCLARALIDHESLFEGAHVLQVHDDLIELQLGHFARPKHYRL